MDADTEGGGNTHFPFIACMLALILAPPILSLLLVIIVNNIWFLVPLIAAVLVLLVAFIWKPWATLYTLRFLQDVVTFGITWPSLLLSWLPKTLPFLRPMGDALYWSWKKLGRFSQAVVCGIFGILAFLTVCRGFSVGLGDLDPVINAVFGWTCQPCFLSAIRKLWSYRAKLAWVIGFYACSLIIVFCYHPHYWNWSAADYERAVNRLREQKSEVEKNMRELGRDMHDCKLDLRLAAITQQRLQDSMSGAMNGQLDQSFAVGDLQNHNDHLTERLKIYERLHKTQADVHVRLSEDIHRHTARMVMKKTAQDRISLKNLTPATWNIWQTSRDVLVDIIDKYCSEEARGTVTDRETGRATTLLEMVAEGARRALGRPLQYDAGPATHPPQPPPAPRWPADRRPRGRDGPGGYAPRLSTRDPTAV